MIILNTIINSSIVVITLWMAMEGKGSQRSFVQVICASVKGIVALIFIIVIRVIVIVTLIFLFNITIAKLIISVLGVVFVSIIFIS